MTTSKHTILCLIFIYLIMSFGVCFNSTILHNENAISTADDCIIQISNDVTIHSDDAGLLETTFINQETLLNPQLRAGYSKSYSRIFIYLLALSVLLTINLRFQICVNCFPYTMDRRSNLVITYIHKKDGAKPNITLIK